MQTLSTNPSTNISNPSAEGRDWIDNTVFDSGGIKDVTEEVNSNFGKDLYFSMLSFERIYQFWDNSIFVRENLVYKKINEVLGP